MRVVSVNTGRPALVVHAGRQYSTAISRRVVANPVRLTLEGFVGDRVADAENHGGPDKAACCYSHEHYPYWAGRLGVDLPVPSFGENLTTEGLLETEVCIGDVFHIGRAVVQVTQPRQPCWKLANRLNCPDLPAQITERGFTGFYVRTLEEGDVQCGDGAELVERPNPGVTVALTARNVLTSQKDRQFLEGLAGLPQLSAAWRERVARLLAER